MRGLIIDDEHCRQEPWRNSRGPALRRALAEALQEELGTEGRPAIEMVDHLEEHPIGIAADQRILLVHYNNPGRGQTIEFLSRNDSHFAVFFGCDTNDTINEMPANIHCFRAPVGFDGSADWNLKVLKRVLVANSWTEDLRAEFENYSVVLERKLDQFYKAMSDGGKEEDLRRLREELFAPDPA